MNIIQKNNPILVCFALREEAAPFRRIVKGNPFVHVLITGMGQRNAETAVRAALDQSEPSLVVTCGFAGGLNPELLFGVVLYEEDPDAGLGPILDTIGAERARFYCARRMLITPEEKRALRDTTGAAAVEMESGHIHALCRERAIPCVTIRVISDTADEELPLDFNELLTHDIQISFAKLGLALFRHPGKIPQMLELRKRTTAAAKKLANVLRLLLKETSAP
jgi:adenosylhomocysteine nucleosidase